MFLNLKKSEKRKTHGKLKRKTSKRKKTGSIKFHPYLCSPELLIRMNFEFEKI
jgi:hypothetical protein